MESETVNITTSQQQPGWVTVAVERKWACRKPGHSHHRANSSMVIRESEIGQVIAALMDYAPSPRAAGEEKP